VNQQQRNARGGFLIGLLVFAGLAFLALAIHSMLFVSGSMTRSERLSVDRWKTRNMARNGLVVATNLLRKRRWWDAGTDVYTMVEANYLGTKTSADLGLDESEGKFKIYAELVIRPGGPFETPGATPIEYEELHHIDVFVKGMRGGDSLVAYGAFLMTPAVSIYGTSTDSILGGPTTKRLVRVSYFPESEYQDLDDVAVRNSIRQAVANRSASALDNYLKINWNIASLPTLTSGIDETAADTFLGNFVSSAPAGVDREAKFLRDRIHDVLFQGTPVGVRSSSAWYRRLDANVPSCPPQVAAAEFICGKAGVPWIEPACKTPDAWDVEPTGVGPGAETAMTVHETDVGATPDAGYIARMIVTEPIIRDYTYGCSASYSASLTAGDVPSGSFRNPFFGNTWCSGPSCTISDPPSGTVNYILEARTGPDPTDTVVYSAQLQQLTNFFGRYYGLADGEPIPDAIASGHYDPSPPVVGGGGGGGGAPHFGGGFGG
jgi:hypothetical protein